MYLQQVPTKLYSMLQRRPMKGTGEVYWPCYQILISAVPSHQHAAQIVELQWEVSALSPEVGWDPCDKDYKRLFMYLARGKGHILREMAAYATHSFSTGWALTILLWASSLSILCLSSISLCCSSSCLTKLSSWKPSGLVQGFGSGFGGTWTMIVLDRMIQEMSATENVQRKIFTYHRIVCAVWVRISFVNPGLFLLRLLL